jgi:hypothetical protein
VFSFNCEPIEWASAKYNAVEMRIIERFPFNCGPIEWAPYAYETLSKKAFHTSILAQVKNVVNKAETVRNKALLTGPETPV